MSWITLYPDWYISEQRCLARSYPTFCIDKGALQEGRLVYYGELIVRPPGGARRHPVLIEYPEATPYELPIVVPLHAMPSFNDEGYVTDLPTPKIFDYRHQMATGQMCLFQRETRGPQGGEKVPINFVLKRASDWFLGHHTGRWPPEAPENELQEHFRIVGNVLLPETFFDPDLDTFGRFRMVFDMSRAADAENGEDPPSIMLWITKQTSSAELLRDTRNELRALYPWLSEELFNPDTSEFSETGTLTDMRNAITEEGNWWFLPARPSPFRDGAGILRALGSLSNPEEPWALLRNNLGRALTLSNRHFIGLCYPGEGEELEWLVVFVQFSQQKTLSGGVILKTDAKKRMEFENAPVKCFRVNRWGERETELRNRGVVDPSIREKHVCLIGLGALGSRVAELLAQAGVRRFTLCDPDRLRTGNVSRHIGGLSDFGAPKTRIVASRIRDIHPEAQITSLPCSAVGSIRSLKGMMTNADLIVSTVADENVESEINNIAVLNNRTVLYGRSLRRGSMGRIFYVRPRLDPCKECLGILAAKSRCNVSEDSWIDIHERPEDVVFHECGRPVIPASAIDLALVASLIARVALSHLEGNSFKENHWVWSREEVDEFGGAFSSPNTILAKSYRRDPHCAICQDPPITYLDITTEAQQSMIEEALSVGAVETGGILMGYVDENRRAIVEVATGPGPNALKSKTEFRRDIDYVQRKLEESAALRGTQGVYIGEWHTHLERDPMPSPRDIESLTGIAESINYPTRNPVMIILGVDEHHRRIAAVKSWVFPLYSRMHEVVNSYKSTG